MCHARSRSRSYGGDCTGDNSSSDTTNTTLSRGQRLRSAKGLGALAIAGDAEPAVRLSRRRVGVELRFGLRALLTLRFGFVRLRHVRLVDSYIGVNLLGDKGLFQLADQRREEKQKSKKGGL